MHLLIKIIAKTPLIIRVVSLYAVVLFVVFLHIQASSLINLAVAGIPIVRKVDKQITYGPIVSKMVIDGQPQSFSLDRLNINLPIKDGVFDAHTGEWTLSDDAVYHATITKLPNNQRGSTFIYGHNKDSVIARTSDLIIGDTASITTVNGHTFNYIYTHDALIPPDLTDVLYEDPEMPQLIVMTCDGAWSQVRRLMYFELLEAK